MSQSPAGAEEAVAPTRVVELFNGKDLTGWRTWLKGTGRADPQRVFTVENGMIHISGRGLGYLATQQAYKDYHLVVEYRWGRYTETGKGVRNSGVLLHGVGPDGGAHGTWMTCLECQLAQGCEGDLIVIRGQDAAGKLVPGTITCDTRLAADGKTRWQKGGQSVVYAGKQFWWSKHQPFFEELLDTRGKDDVASPVGQWTKVECLCAGERVTVKINGVAVNECYHTFPAAGNILLQNEGSEIYFRNVRLEPL
ncbi:MAG: DUF1080 domain-containing protein [Thermoguttaceae bacterium]|jgi:hypothetical protein